MRIKSKLFLSAAAIGVAVLLAAAPPTQVVAQNTVAIDADDIGGVVTGASGPEAGVWVIAETRDLPTRFTKAVVTDDQGRYVLPDLPKAKYQVWVRGYGLVDSPKVESEPGKQLNLRAVPAPNEAAAAAYYPAIHWYTMMKIPEASLFGAARGDLPANVKQIDYLNLMKNNGCVGCHQLGTLSTRTIPAFFGNSSKDAWMKRIQAGQAGELMVNIIAGQLNAAPIAYLADWTDRVAKGELPSTKPTRPQGLERNIVVTTWDWATEKHYLHDLVSTDRRNPTVNGGGPVYGQPEYSMGFMPILDPKTHATEMYKAPIRDPDMHENLGPTHAARMKPLGPSAYWGEEKIWEAYFNNHNSMLDEKGRVWMAASFRDETKQPAYCKDPSHPSAKLFPVDRSGRQLTVYDPKTKKYDFVDICFTTHHLNFAHDANNTLWTSSGGGGGVVGWVNVKKWDETHDPAQSVGWTALVMDTNGDGKRGEYTEPNQPADPTKDRRLGQVIYAVAVSPVDNTVWGTIRQNPGAIVRIIPGANPPETTLTENFNVPLPGFGPRGGDVDSQGVYWVSLASGHIGSFDRRLCKGPMNGPQATGNHCPEGWKFYQYPGPGFAGIGPNSAESSYYSWVDQHDTFGMGKDVPVSTANLMDGLVALGKDGKMVSLRVPYPMGFFAKGLDGRIDDPNAGWKGRGLWTSSGDRAPWQVEGGKGMKPMAVHFQMRPDPLAH
jgi:hypothetical protein